jgi:hypothetical protein
MYGPALRLTVRGCNDFMNFYSGARLVGTPELYNTERMISLQKEVTGWSSHNKLYCRPPFYALLLSPLGRLSYEAANWVWEGLLLAGFAAFIALWPYNNRWIVGLCLSWSLPAFTALAQGQDVAFILGAVAAFAAAMKRERPFAAGCVLAVCSIKFHLFLLVPVWIIGQKRWRVGAGMLVSGAVLVAVSFAAGGLNWPLEFFRLLAGPETNPNPEAMPNLHGLFTGMAHGVVLEALGTLAVAAAVLLAVRSQRFEYGFAAVLAGGLLIARHDYLADCALMIPAVLILHSTATGGWQRFLRLFLLVPFGYLPLLLSYAAMTSVALLAFVFGLAADGFRHNRSLEHHGRTAWKTMVS